MVTEVTGEGAQQRGTPGDQCRALEAERIAQGLEGTIGAHEGVRRGGIGGAQRVPDPCAPDPREGDPAAGGQGAVECLQAVGLQPEQGLYRAGECRRQREGHRGGGDGPARLDRGQRLAADPYPGRERDLGQAGGVAVPADLAAELAGTWHERGLS